MNTVTETFYPLTFREEDAKTLGNHLRLRHSVELIGMKRVGISNFLRFFLNHQDISSHYINHDQKHLFVGVDLNNLVEFKIYPFWILTFKRLVDALESSECDEKVKKNISSLFLSCIQSGDLFLTVDSIRQALIEVINSGVLPTFFFIRFDKLQEVATDELFANLQGFIDATDHKVSYVFTSSRSLDQVSPDVFSRRSLSSFSQLMYFKPASRKDMQIIFDTFEKTYELSPSQEVLEELMKLSGGHVQYLIHCLIILKEKSRQQIKSSDIKTVVLADERINLQSEEIWESLQKDEQLVLKKILNGQRVTKEETLHAKYLHDTGIVKDEEIFSPLFQVYLEQHHQVEESSVEMTKKEHALYSLFLKNSDQICEREMIIEAVWPEYEESGVSDWTLDRLVARVREKMRKQNSPYLITTVRTRGYKMSKN